MPTIALGLAIHTLLSVAAIFHVLMYKRDPRAALAWIMIALFFPYGGGAYFLLGVNRVRSRARGLRLLRIPFEGDTGHPTLVSEQVGLAGVGERISGEPLILNNHVHPMFSGQQTYTAMLEAIDSAKQRLWLSTYIFKPDAVGLEFADRLQAASQRGVDVRVLIDGIGEWYSLRNMSRLLKRREISVAHFVPPRLLPPSLRLNIRNHRKLLISDCRTAFVGGMNIADYHRAGADENDGVDDAHFQIFGQSVELLADVFAHDWRFATGEVLPLEAFAERNVGDMSCRVIADGPDEALDALAMTIESAISAARQRVDIMTPYFIPSRSLLGALISASLRGVVVRLVLPERSNLRWVDWASRNTQSELLHWGVQVFYQPPPFCHAKLLTIDNDYALIGSANLDPRSLRLNFEIGVEVFSGAFCRQLADYFAERINRSRTATAADFSGRPTLTRLRDSAAALASPYL